MIQSGLASLVVLSTDTEPATVSEILAIKPSRVVPRGVALRSGRVPTHHTWSLDVDRLTNTTKDQTGTRVLRELLERASGAVGRIDKLPEDCETRILWSAHSDSCQGGFVLPVDLVGQVSALGVAIYGTVYLDEEAENAPTS